MSLLKIRAVCDWKISTWEAPPYSSVWNSEFFRKCWPFLQIFQKTVRFCYYCTKICNLPSAFLSANLCTRLNRWLRQSRRNRCWKVLQRERQEGHWNFWRLELRLIWGSWNIIWCLAAVSSNLYYGYPCLEKILWENTWCSFRRSVPRPQGQTWIRYSTSTETPPIPATVLRVNLPFLHLRPGPRIITGRGRTRSRGGNSWVLMWWRRGWLGAGGWGFWKNGSSVRWSIFTPRRRRVALCGPTSGFLTRKWIARLQKGSWMTFQLWDAPFDNINYDTDHEKWTADKIIVLIQ